MLSCYDLQVPSDKIQFNQKPEMKAKEITAAGIEALKSGKYKMIRINYANPDMVGHTGEGRSIGLVLGWFWNVYTFGMGSLQIHLWNGVLQMDELTPIIPCYSGDLAATIKSCEVVDSCVKELLAVADSVNAR